MKQNPTPWIKASRSDGNGSCVQLRRHDDRIEVRDSKLGNGSPILSFTLDEMLAFQDGVNKSEFDHLLD